MPKEEQEKFNFRNRLPGKRSIIPNITEHSISSEKESVIIKKQILPEHKLAPEQQKIADNIREVDKKREEERNDNNPYYTRK